MWNSCELPERNSRRTQRAVPLKRPWPVPARHPTTRSCSNSLPADEEQAMGYSSQAHPISSPTASHWRDCLLRWRHNVRSRRLLAQMSEHDLADLAISPSERYVEVSKPFWR
ncbi:DUF1127 domain-containing protein [Pseudomonas paraeruginosa]|uniref:DUF1127 domain-containing protein n=2 Tax=Pseudomonas TaxID=286 RepID=UPI00289A2B55|nr:DUF1127 domain-containing protein [Pseudomonas paraeruginosa]